MSIRVLLADDHRLVREGLAGLLRAEPDVDVIGQANDGAATVAMARALRPDVVIMDVQMPRLSGVDATQQILADDPRAKVIGLSGHDEPRLVAAMIDAGASGYVLKDSAFDELVSAVRVTMANQSYLSPGVAGVVVNGFRSHRNDAARTPFTTLTLREREIATLLARGVSTKEIAARLAVSPKTVGTHREHILAKLGVRSIAELTRHAIAAGL
jgi:DNA-binding NarL/FixJ family response regulator